MLASGCAACRCELPVVCLHFTLFNLGSMVCESQLASLLIRASPLNMSACHNACWLVILYPKCPWVVRGCSCHCQRYAGHQSLWQKEKQRRRRSGDRDLRHLEALHHICPQLFSMRLITHTHTPCLDSLIQCFSLQSASLWNQWLCHHVIYLLSLSLYHCPFLFHLLWLKQVFCKQTVSNTSGVFSYDSVKRLHHLSTQQW